MNPSAGNPQGRWRWWAGITVVAIAAAVTTPAIVLADDSRALQPVPQTGGPGRLALSSSAQPLLIPSLEPGSSYSWQIEATLSGETSGRLELGVVASGSRATGTDGYQVSARGCRQQWRSADGVDTSPTCGDPAGSSTVLARTPLASVSGLSGAPIGELTPAAPWYVSLTLDLPSETTQRAETGDLAIGVRFTATGDDGSDLGGAGSGVTGGVDGGGADSGGASGWGGGSVGYPGASGSGQGGGTLSWTGAPLSALTVAGLTAVAAGVLLAGIARLRRRSAGTSSVPGPTDGTSR